MSWSRIVPLAVLALATCVAGRPATAEPSPSGDGYGVLIMAHGGGPAWNQTVLDAVAPLRDRYPVEVAFGMADACSLQEGVRKLEAQGVRTIGVVRLFISGESWSEETAKILGLREGAPPADANACGGHHDHGAAHHSMAFFRLDSRASFSLSKQGLSEAPEVGPILAERARSLSRAPEQEDVLVLAHGPGDDAENQRWIASIEARAAEIRTSLPFHEVQVMTLREDWPEKRKEAEQRVVDYVARARKEGRKAIVIPFRLSGFGPYAEVLAGQEYVADQQGLLPHANITRWVERQAEELRTDRLAAERQ